MHLRTAHDPQITSSLHSQTSSQEEIGLAQDSIILDAGILF
jgi:hypothetical protein